MSDERARGIRDVLMSDEMFTGWGVRTLASSHPAYNPVGYHTGSVWPHDSALIAFGLRRYGFDEDFTLIFEGLLEAASRFDDYRLPELFAGFPRAEFDEPVPYPVACQPQAWAAGSIPFLLKWGLGLSPDALSKRLAIVRPSLPRWLNRVEVTGLALGDAKIDLVFERAGEQVTLADARHRRRRRGGARDRGRPPRPQGPLSGRTAGPSITSPLPAKREPWQGQSQVRSAVFQLTMQPRCVQRADSSCSVPSSSR